MESEKKESISATRRRRLSPADRREQILDAALACCIRNASFEVSMIEVAREVGVSRNLVYHYFSNQDTLMNAMISREAQTIQSRIAEIPFSTPEETMFSVILEYLRTMTRNVEALRTALATPRIREKVSPHLEELQELVAMRLAEALGFSWSGTVKNALLSGANFILHLVRETGRDLHLAEEAAAELCVNVCRQAAEGAARIDRETAAAMQTAAH